MARASHNAHLGIFHKPSGKCISQESNPGHIDGDDVFYRETPDAWVPSAEKQRPDLGMCLSGAACALRAFTPNSWWPMGMPRGAANLLCATPVVACFREFGSFWVWGLAIPCGRKCRDLGSNRGPSDLQSDALPAELSRLGILVRPSTCSGVGWLGGICATHVQRFAHTFLYSATSKKPPVGIEPTTIRLQSACSTN